ncbi:50S ribosomal protein L5 [Candidatus Woesearchaeota archaeon]|nr:50S ribosomal protein L5 [Candidatus Woesearchaeota archaeon]
MKNKENKMRDIRIEKITLNIGTGQPGDKLDKAVILLQTIAQQKPIKTKTMKRIPTWGLRPRLEIGCKVTIRGKKAELLLSRLLDAIDHSLAFRNFDNKGNLSFGIPEYIDIPNTQYNPQIGIIGLEAAITFQRKGYRISKRRYKKIRIPISHQITQEDSINFLKNKFQVRLKEDDH